jgi:RNA polymerase sigma-70 factor (ECF subfamily)
VSTDAESSERQIAVRLAAGDQQALQQTLDVLGPSVAGLLRQHFGAALQEADIEDVMSIALYRLWIYRQQYQVKRSSLKTWLFLLARSAALDLLRKSGRERQRLGRENSGSMTEAPTIVSRPIQETERLRQVLQTSLESLGDTDRRIILAYALKQGQEPWATELAEELHIPAGTIRVRRARLFEKIREAAN